jgi:hypothetical protein
MARRSVFVALLSAAAVAAGCGGNGEDLYEIGPVRTCLRDVPGVRLSKADDVVSSTALGGAVRARFPDNEVTVALGESLEDADQTERAYRRFAPRTLPIDHVLKRDRNAVLLWTTTPSEADAAAVTRCLRA